MISVDEALSELFALVSPLAPEKVRLRKAAGRVLARDAMATRDQPPFSSSSMDGYALRGADAKKGAQLTIIGEAAAGHGFGGTVGGGEAVRIFTGAPLPSGANHVEMQENVTREGNCIRLDCPEAAPANVRPRGGDFRSGDTVTAPRILSPADVALLASMNVAQVSVTRRPEVALISTGDELVMPGETPGPDQIIASNTLGLEALLRKEGALPRVLPIARDTHESLESVFRFARGADLIVTIGGASEGDHDLVRKVAGSQGLTQSFYKVAMRPGKPLMAGRLAGIPIIGLPGNPVSALVCGYVFLLPVLRAMLGLPARPAPRQTAALAHDIGSNGPREHYMRGRLNEARALEVFNSQDSSLLGLLSRADALAIRPPHDPPRKAGDKLNYLPFA